MVLETFKKGWNDSQRLALYLLHSAPPSSRFFHAHLPPPPKCHSDTKLESLQRQALKIVYGTEICYKEALALANIKSLEDRRTELTLKFATSAQSNPRFSDGWFPKKNPSHYLTRQNRPFFEERVRTERMKKNPLTYMRRALNDNI